MGQFRAGNPWQAVLRDYGVMNLRIEQQQGFFGVPGRIDAKMEVVQEPLGAQPRAIVAIDEEDGFNAR